MKPKRILSTLFLLAMLLVLLPINTAFASEPISIAGVTLYDSDNDGYYEIGTADELYAFAQAVNYLYELHINVKLTNNITVNEKVPSSYEEYISADNDEYRRWTPIGRNDLQPYFGTFDGNGKTISGLYCIESNESGQVGLFGCISRAGDGEDATVGTVKNLTIKDSYFCNVNSSPYIGAVVGLNISGTVSGCKNENSTVYCDAYPDSAYVGGVVGYSYSYYGNAAIQNCSNSGTVSTKSSSSSSGSVYAGGVIGFSNAVGSLGVTVQNCSNSGTVSAASTICSIYAGGVIGFSANKSGTVTIQNCSNSGTVSAKSSSSTSGSVYAGGVIGFSSNNSGYVTVQNCSNSGTVSNESSAQYRKSYTGGVIGFSSNDSGPVTIQKCCNTGSLNVSSYSSIPSSVGGVVGFSRVGPSYAAVQNCFNTGSFNVTAYPSSPRVGGVIGDITVNSGLIEITSCYNVGYYTDDEDDDSSVIASIIGYDGSYDSDSVTIENCYYLDDGNDGNKTHPFNGIMCLDEDYFIYGEVAYFLNYGVEYPDEGTDGSSSETVWKQTIGVDKYPNFTGLEVRYDGQDCYNDLSKFKIHSVGDDKKSATVVLNKAGTYTIVFADYEDSKLANVETVEVTVDSAQPVCVVSNKKLTLGTGDKIMLWDNLKNLIPLCEAYEVK